MTVERFVGMIVVVGMMALGALVVTGCVVGVYWLVGLML